MNELTWNHRYARANGIDVHYVRHGRGMPLILLHGWPEFWYVYRKNVPALAERFDVLVPDLRGFGETEKPDLPDPPSDLLGDLVEDLKGLTDALGLGRFRSGESRCGFLCGPGLRQKVPGKTPGPVLLSLCLPGYREALARSRQRQGGLVPVLQPAALGCLAGRQRPSDLQDLLQALPRPLGRQAGSLR